MVFLNAINGESEHILSPTHTNKWCCGQNHGPVSNVALGRYPHSFAEENIAGSSDRDRSLQQVIKTLQCYIDALKKEPIQAPMEASTTTSQAESAARSTINQLCSEIHTLVRRSCQYKVNVDACILLI